MKHLNQYIKESLLDNEDKLVNAELSNYNKIKYNISELMANRIKDHNMLKYADIFISLYKDYKKGIFDKLENGYVNGLEIFCMLLGASLFIGIKNLESTQLYHFIIDPWSFILPNYTIISDWNKEYHDLYYKYYDLIHDAGMNGTEFKELFRAGVFDNNMLKESLLDDEKAIINKENDYIKICCNISKSFADNLAEVATDLFDYADEFIDIYKNYKNGKYKGLNCFNKNITEFAKFILIIGIFAFYSHKSSPDIKLNHKNSIFWDNEKDEVLIYSLIINIQRVFNISIDGNTVLNFKNWINNHISDIDEYVNRFTSKDLSDTQIGNTLMWLVKTGATNTKEFAF